MGNTSLVLWERERAREWLDGNGRESGMLKSRDRFRTRDVSRTIFDGLGLGLEGSGLGLGLGLEVCGLGLDVSGLGHKGHCWPRCRKCKHFQLRKHKFVACTLLAAHLVYLLILTFVLQSTRQLVCDGMLKS